MADRSKQFKKYVAYIASQAKRAREEGEEFAAFEPAITISRETGAGAITLGEKIADLLNAHFGTREPAWTVFDKNLIEQVLEDHDLPEDLVRFMPEDKPNTLKDAIGDMLGIHPPNWELVKYTHETIYKLARMGTCIIVGRGANIVTKDLPNVLHLRLVGSLEKRVARCMEYYKISESEANDLIKKQDRARRHYLLAYYDKDIDDPMNYHLIINVDMFTTEELVRLVCDVVLNRKNTGFK